jgi:hypothetical protein
MLKRARAVLGTALAVAIAASTFGRVEAQAYTTKFVTSITYQNIGTATANISLNFYNENTGTATTQVLPALPGGAGASFGVGNAAGLSAGFKGSAVLSADQPIVATMVQVPQNSTTVRNRPLSNGFGSGAGAASVRIPTVLKNTFDQTTQFSIQNVDSVGVDLEIKFINADAAAGGIGDVVTTQTLTNLPAGAAKYYDAGTVAGLLATFNGSVTITAKQTGTTTDGKIVATALELNVAGAGASAFEGLSSDAATLYMPSAICNAFGGQTTAYAVQNTGTANATVTVEYSYRDVGTPAAPLSTKTDAKTVAPGAKASFNACTGGVPANSSGSAVITSVGSNIVAIGKVFGAGLSTAAPGATAGASKLALPYVRYSVTQFDSGARQRTFIAVQNVGASDLAAGAVTVKYIGRDGTLLGTHTLGALPAKGKLSSNATLATGDAAALAEFGYYSDGFGGSAVVEGPAGSQLVVVGRVQSTGVGEDYNGIPIN